LKINRRYHLSLLLKGSTMRKLMIMLFGALLLLATASPLAFVGGCDVDIDENVSQLELAD
jgi:hypothetical protein